MIHKVINNLIICPTINKVDDIILNQLLQVMTMQLTCLIFLWEIRLLEICMELWLSQRMIIEDLIGKPRSPGSYQIQTTFVNAFTVPWYSASKIDKDTNNCFLHN